MADARRSAIGSLPNRVRMASHPATAPGTVTVSMPLAGIRVMPFDARNAGVNAAGAHPAAFIPYSLPVRAS